MVKDVPMPKPDLGKLQAELVIARQEYGEAERAYKKADNDKHNAKCRLAAAMKNLDAGLEALRNDDPPWDTPWDKRTQRKDVAA